MNATMGKQQALFNLNIGVLGSKTVFYSIVIKLFTSKGTTFERLRQKSYSYQGQNTKYCVLADDIYFYIGYDIDINVCSKKRKRQLGISNLILHNVHRFVFCIFIQADDKR
ncbi:MAG: hypothetical protein LBT96_00725 [Campylobacteraceae bacterium]|jgi:hypothetical protein|nr:hypothetical protein [Campylobacteraceae bacterium]